ncbi:MAG TPA: hypothetical protein VGH19_13655 [Verrucomicrobiae bacterium]
MKLLFTISMGLNLLFVAGIAYHKLVKECVAPVVSREHKAVKVVSDNKPVRTGPVLVEVEGEPFHWRQLESDDYHRYAANLRVIGCPETTVQDILHSDVYKAYAARLREMHKNYRLNRDGSSADYWKREGANHAVLMAKAREVMRINLEKHELLYSLLGVDIDQARKLRHGLPDIEGARFPFMSAHKITLAQEIWSRFAEMEFALSCKYGEYHGQEPYIERSMLHRERETELLKVITTTELMEYKLRTSERASKVRYNLEAFEPAEQEFRVIYLLEEKYERPIEVMMQENDIVTTQKNEEAAKQKEREIRIALGGARYQEYLVASSFDYQAAYRAVQQSDLPSQTARQIYDLKNATMQQMQRVQDDTGLSVEQRQQTMKEIHELAGKAVKDLLGEKGYGIYRNSGGQWLRRVN